MNINELVNKAKNLLTPDELGFFYVMAGMSGTLYVEGPPGAGKSSILRSIATKLSMNYMPFDCPAMEDTQIGLYPAKVEVGGEVWVEDIPPAWVQRVINNTTPTLIVFEEINRNPRLINAILNLLNERRVGYHAYSRLDLANAPVLLAATGNLGEEDGTIVEELDAAQSGRLIRRRYQVDGENGRSRWDNSFASVPSADRPKGQVLTFIREYLKANPANIRPKIKDNEVPVDSRRWTYLSEMLINTVGYEQPIKDYIPVVELIGHDYVGGYSIDLLRFMQERVALTVGDILNGVGDRNISREMKAEISVQLAAIDICELEPDKLNNLLDFMATCEVELICQFITAMVTNPTLGTIESEYKEFINHPNMVALRTRFSAEIAKLKSQYK